MTNSEFRHLKFSELDSTNAKARRLCENGERGPLWITAEQQSQGRGRRGRDWVSEPGNLYATFLTTLSVVPATAAQLSFVTAIAIYDAAAKFLSSGDKLTLKWPNDVLLNDQKLSGILLETVSTQANSEISIAIGCGINLAHSPDDTSYGATCLNKHSNENLTPDKFLSVFANELNNQMRIWENGNNFDLIAKAWQNRASHIGKVVSLTSSKDTITGKFQRLALDGALVLELADGSQQHFHAGDVSFRPVSNN